jgi:hypothetical protein
MAAVIVSMETPAAAAMASAWRHRDAMVVM